MTRMEANRIVRIKGRAKIRLKVLKSWNWIPKHFGNIWLKTRTIMKAKKLVLGITTWKREALMTKLSIFSNAMKKWAMVDQQAPCFSIMSSRLHGAPKLRITNWGSRLVKAPTLRSRSPPTRKLGKGWPSSNTIGTSCWTCRERSRQSERSRFSRSSSIPI